MKAGHIRIFYPADPAGVVPGGIDTFIRGVIKWAPAELEFSLVGMSTDPVARPVGVWTRCQIGPRAYDFFPVVAVTDAGARGRLPLSLRFTAGAWRHRAALRTGFDAFDFHRPEPSLLYLADSRPKNGFFHQDPKTIASSASDNLWRRLPAAYQRLERHAVQQLTSAWCVRESGVLTLRQRYPHLDDKVSFLPTWVDPQVFYPASPAERLAWRAQLAQQHGINPAARWVSFVGRLDTQKNPQLLFDAFASVCARGVDGALLVIGDGVLKRELLRQATVAGVQGRVHFLGLLPQAAIAQVLQAADLFALSSAYEGMPMALLEALGCGLPAISTDVGEVRRVLRHGVNGIVVKSHDAADYADGLARALHAVSGAVSGADSDWRAAALAAVAPFTPAQVLQPVYARYLQLASAPWRVRQLALLQDQMAGPERRRSRVAGVPIDVMRSSAVVAQLVRWARNFESRTVCFCNVHSAVLAGQDEGHRLALRSADLVVPDGAPVAWTLRRKGHQRQDRVDGPGTMWRLCAAAREKGIKVGLYGSTPAVLQALKANLLRIFPGLDVAYAFSAPFREATPEEDAAICAEITEAQVGLLFVGLGCPKQERWIAQHRGKIPAVMLGLGAAFDFHAGMQHRAPQWMRSNGLEWLHRLGAEPGRLWWRYVSSNTLFVLGTGADMLREGWRGVQSSQTPKVGAYKLVPASAYMSAQMPEPLPLPEAADSTSFSEQSSSKINLKGGLKTGRPGGTMRAALDPRAIEDLVARIDADMPARRTRVVGFVSCSSGEGTSTLARAFAKANVQAMGRSVLLLHSAQPANGNLSLVDALRDGQRWTQALSKHPSGLTEGALGVGAATDGGRATPWNLLTRHELWGTLRDSFELVVVDMKSADASDAALKVAPLCDGVVVVLEAARTRAPVVAQLLSNLNAVHARVLGTVLNKRHFHLPAALYRWL